MQTILDLLADLGAGTASSLWLPVLAWTILAMPIYGVLQHCRLSVHFQYRIRQGLLLALPIGLLFGVTSSWISSSFLPPGMQAPLDVSEVDVSLPPFPEATASSAPHSWSRHHVVGLLTVAACGIGAWRSTQFLADALALVRSWYQTDFRIRPSVQRLTNRLANNLGVQRPVRTWIASGNIVPQTRGLFHPTIIVPEALAEDRDALRMTLTHELVHVRRCDCAAQWIERLVASVFAVHPGVGMLRRSIARLREQSCDAAVLGTKAVGHSQYAALLYRVSTSLSSGNSVALRIGNTASSLQDRIRAMHEYRAASGPLSPLASVVMGLLTIGLALGVTACSDFGGESPAPSSERTAQSVGRSEVLLSGRVVDSQSGEPIPHVNIIRAYDEGERSSRDGFGEAIGATNEEGEFTAPDLSAGSHRLIISCVGYERKTGEITLRAGHPQTMTIELQRETMSLQGIEVNASDTE